MVLQLNPRPGHFGFKLKLPAKQKPGVHKLKITFTPDRSSTAAKMTLTIRFDAPRARRSAAAVAHTPFLPG